MGKKREENGNLQNLKIDRVYIYISTDNQNIEKCGHICI